MKLQSLAVIFIIIIIPISLVLSSYTQNQIKTLNLQTSYDSKLKNATYDAVKAFQLNTANSSTSDIAASKIRDIEASANTFLNSVAANFGLSGASKEAIKDYVPAIVYTMYDGYYIYSPYTNTIPNEALNGKSIHNDSTYKSDQKMYGIKPYIYYSCRYKTNNSDFVITYALDNYITIQGMIGGKYENKSGYLIDKIDKIDENTVKYRNIKIEGEKLQEYVGNELYTYIKINGTKYYEDNNTKKWFSLINGKKVYTGDSYDETDYSAVNYYKEACDFTNWVENHDVLKNLTYGDAVDANGRNFAIGDAVDNGETNYTQNGGLVGNITIFKDNVSIEEPTSNFNQHRLAVIRNAIETNLSVAIANYNNYTGVETNFVMPTLAEDEWELILNNISVISFLQGMSIGGKIYNGYAVVPNNKNGEVVTEDSIYITTSDGEYHRVREKGLNNSIEQAYFNMDFEVKMLENDDGTTSYYYPHKEFGSYTSIVAQTNVADYDNIYTYLDGDDKEKLAKTYYTALGRERYSMYKTSKDIDISEMSSNNGGNDSGINTVDISSSHSNGSYTNKDITLTANIKNYGKKLKYYAWTDTNVEPSSWETLSEDLTEYGLSVTVDKNMTKYFWIKSEDGLETHTCSYEVKCIDKLKPSIPDITVEDVTPNSITISIEEVNDSPATSENGCSGIKSYTYSISKKGDSKSSSSDFNSTSVTISGLYPNTEYVVGVIVTDNAGNSSRTYRNITTSSSYY